LLGDGTGGAEAEEVQGESVILQQDLLLRL